MIFGVKKIIPGDWTEFDISIEEFKKEEEGGEALFCIECCGSSVADEVNKEEVADFLDKLGQDVANARKIYE